MICGVYQIKNIVNGHVYVGSSLDTQKREREHWRSLRRGTHHSRYLQNAWNKYGEDSFVFEVLEECYDYDLEWLEQSYMFKLSPEYNVNPSAFNCRDRRHTKEAIQKMCEAKSGENHPRSVLSGRDVNQIKILYRSGKFKQRELAERFGISTSHVSAIVLGKYWKQDLSISNVES